MRQPKYGFGLALVHELSSRPATEISKIYATARGDSTPLSELATASAGRVPVVQLDVTDELSIRNAAAEVEKQLSGKGLDILINNAGVCQDVGDGVKLMDHLAESFTINVPGVHYTTQAVLPLLQRGSLKKVANLITSLASITLARASRDVPAPAYKISKFALHALTVQYALDHEKDDFAFVAIAPGWMKTDLGSGDIADLTPEQGAKASLEILFRPNGEINGQFLKVLVPGWENATGRNVYDGTMVPW
ncbi:short chain dehydrogenase reductase [Aspergillus brunneoviolaceus CBS 621.78]|uniref:Short chain dehydrogenase reductase n=1 Tax=Aspergillus brunneoviolaceus CBS 621.78 TaxID=1450534 RepID=A0ACD1GIK3_9EURO|nr:short chain dehydrogenase reductase [Aspergillus brunneoviolaceus CBS 621.78]RAH48934.1 short chain dehydrogenase reductase [Aspergillus brunneoviolaceus CBS 621.78]